MVAFNGDALLQVPPEVASDSAVVEPIHTEVVPVMAATVGNGFTVKLLALVPVPDGVVNEIVPVVAPAGKVAVTWVLLF